MGTFAGNPALTLCNGLSTHGLPLAVQIIGRWFHEDQVLSAGRAIETPVPWPVLHRVSP